MHIHIDWEMSWSTQDCIGVALIYREVLYSICIQNGQCYGISMFFAGMASFDQ